MTTPTPDPGTPRFQPGDEVRIVNRAGVYCAGQHGIVAGRRGEVDDWFVVLEAGIQPIGYRGDELEMVEASPGTPEAREKGCLPIPPCANCGAPSDWQIGSYIPFKCTPIFLCDRCISPRLREKAMLPEVRSVHGTARNGEEG